MTERTEQLQQIRRALADVDGCNPVHNGRLHELRLECRYAIAVYGEKFCLRTEVARMVALIAEDPREMMKLRKDLERYAERLGKIAEYVADNYPVTKAEDAEEAMTKAQAKGDFEEPQVEIEKRRGTFTFTTAAGKAWRAYRAGACWLFCSDFLADNMPLAHWTHHCPDGDAFEAALEAHKRG